MQSWRKGLKPTASTPSTNTTHTHDDQCDDTVIEKYSPSLPGDTSDLKMNDKIAPKQFFKTCRSLARLAIEFYPDEKDALATTFLMLGLMGDEPEDKDVEEMGVHMVETFYGQFKEHFEKIITKDETFFDVDHPILLGISAKSKWLVLDQPQKDKIWSEMALLVQYSNLSKMYSLCPSKMMDMITGMAEKVSKQVSNGEMDLSTLNPMELGQSLVSSMSQEEIEEIGKSLMRKETMEDMMSMMQTSLKGLQNGESGLKLPANMGMPDMAQFAQLASMFQK